MKTTGMAAAGAACAAFGPFTRAEALAAAARDGEQVVPTWCGICGPMGTCAVYAFVKDGRFTRVAGMKEAPHNKGTLCCKAHAAPQWVYSPGRLTTPLRRAGKRGEGRFERISWGGAVRAVADRLREQKERYGPESPGIPSPAKRDYSDYLYRFLMAHGSPNYAHSGICAVQLFFALNYTIGGRPGPDYNNADVILIWDKQPVYSGPPLGTPVALVAARERGARICAVKPSIEPDGSFATEPTPPRPGRPSISATAWNTRPRPATPSTPWKKWTSSWWPTPTARPK